MRSATAIRHVAFEDLGSFGPLLERRGYRIGYREAGIDDIAAIDPAGPDLLIVLGGPIGVYDDPDYPFLRDEIRLLERRLAAGKPTLGICLGAQLMARALGARVYPGGRKEIGWSPLALTAAGRDSCLAALAPEKTRVLHWHGDTFDLPEGATLLASTPLFPHQAFSAGPRALALQFHAEVTAPGLERWLIGHAGEIAATPGVSVRSLRGDTAAQAPALERQGEAMLDLWLDQAA